MELFFVEEFVGSLHLHEHRVASRNDDRELEPTLQSKLSLIDKRYDEGGTSQ